MAVSHVFTPLKVLDKLASSGIVVDVRPMLFSVFFGAFPTVFSFIFFRPVCVGFELDGQLADYVVGLFSGFRLAVGDNLKCRECF